METEERVIELNVAETRTGPWIQTVSGGRFWLTDPRPEDVQIEDIAHALGNQCRFAGHCRRFYSIAEHSLNVANQVPMKFRPWALLHDAAEAYVADLPAPLKHLPGLAGYRRIEENILVAIMERFGLHPGGEELWMPPAVREADLRMLMTEKRDLMAECEFSWNIDAEPYGFVVPSDEQRGAVYNFKILAKSLGIE